MQPRDYYLLFGAAWLAAALYAGSMAILGLRVRKLRAAGRLPAEVPSMHDGLAGGWRSLTWMVTGRYAEVDDGTVKRLGLIARLAFGPALVLMLAVFWLTLTDPPQNLGAAPPVTVDTAATPSV